MSGSGLPPRVGAPGFSTFRDPTGNGVVAPMSFLALALHQRKAPRLGRVLQRRKGSADRGQEYLLERRMFTSLSTGEVIHPYWTQFRFRLAGTTTSCGVWTIYGEPASSPTSASRKPSVWWRRRRDGDWRWPLENPHVGRVHFDMEDGAGTPSRWNTLRALRVLDRYSARD
jgi:hypothetical protein